MDYNQFTQAALILLREGAEALLIVAALSAYLVRVGAPEKVSVLYGGAAAAVLASFAAAWIFVAWFGGMHSDLMESVILLIAAAVLIWVSGWLFARRDAAAWTAYLRQRMDRSLGRGGIMTLGLAAFLAVFREGAETILFLQAIALDGGGWSLSLAAGTGVGLGAVAAAYLAVRKLAVRVPLRPFFIGTAALLYLMAVSFTGQAIMEFQEMLWLSYNEVATPQWLSVVGVSDSREGLLAQLFLLLAVPLATRLPVFSPASGELKNRP